MSTEPTRPQRAQRKTEPAQAAGDADGPAVEEWAEAGLVEASGPPRADEAGEALGPNALERIPLGTRRQKLAGEPRPGFYRRWINDVPGRVERAQRAGYTFVKDAQGKPISAPVGKLEEGGGMRAYLMELPEKFREEDNAAKRRTNEEIDDALNRGRVGHQEEDRRYVPDKGISIRDMGLRRSTRTN